MTKPQHTRMIFLGLAIVIVVVLVGLFMRFFNPTPHPAQPTDSKNPSASVLHDIAQQSAAATVSPSDTTNPTEYSPLVHDDLLGQAIPQDAALVKDQLAQLDDIEQQLEQQKQLLEQQHQDADELIRLKEQQLAQLEQQLHASS